MKRVYPSVVALVLLGSLNSPTTADVLQTAVNPANQHTYHLLPAASWTDSQAAAVTLGGHLVTINDQAEHDWVWDTFSGGTRNLWIGLTDSDLFGTTEGDWVWVSGAPVTYVNWYPPDLPSSAHGPETDFAFMWRASSAGGRWADRPDWGPGSPGNLDPSNPQYGVVEAVPAIPGDVTFDGFVGADDLTTLILNWNATGTDLAHGDITGDGFVGADDLSRIIDNWNAGTLPMASAAAPEPASIAWIGLLLIAGHRKSGQTP